MRHSSYLLLFSLIGPRNVVLAIGEVAQGSRRERHEEYFDCCRGMVVIVCVDTEQWINFRMTEGRNDGGDNLRN